MIKFGMQHIWGKAFLWG